MTEYPMGVGPIAQLSSFEYRKKVIGLLVGGLRVIGEGGKNKQERETGIIRAGMVDPGEWT